MTIALFEIAVTGAAFAAGLIGALIGLGGGIIITPLLVIGFGIDIHYAMGASLASVIATSSGAGAAYLRDGISNLRLGLFLCIATTVGAVVGAMLAAVLDTSALLVIFGVGLLMAVGVQLRGHPGSPGRLVSDPIAVTFRLPGALPAASGPKPYHVLHVVPGFVVMLMAGALSGLLGIGSGAFKVLAMDQIMRIPFKVTTATSNFMIGVTAAASVGVYLKHGFFDPILVAPIALGVLGGAFVGAKLLHKAPVHILRITFLTVVFLIALQMILRGAGINL